MQQNGLFSGKYSVSVQERKSKNVSVKLPYAMVVWCVQLWISDFSIKANYQWRETVTEQTIAKCVQES